VVGIVVGIASLLIAIGIIVLVLIVLKRRRRRRKQTTSNKHNANTQQQQEKSSDDELTVRNEEDEKRGTVLIENNQTTTTTDTNRTQSLTNTEVTNLKEPCLILFNELEIGKELGQGRYGRVCIGKWKTKNIQVALKFCHNKGELTEFMREVNLMISIPPHPNVVRMFGVSIDVSQPIIVMEYCDAGIHSSSSSSQHIFSNLKSHIHTHAYIDENTHLHSLILM
jgi:type II secretory pathway pseudopilin PulG